MSVTAPSQVCFPLIDVSEALFYHGVLFTEGKSNKNALSAFFRQLSWTPKKILFIDDKKQMLDDMSTYEQEGVEFVGLRFSGADACVKALDPKICDVELEAFSNLMSDAQAREYAQTR